MLLLSSGFFFAVLFETSFHAYFNYDDNNNYDDDDDVDSDDGDGDDDNNVASNDGDGNDDNEWPWWLSLWISMKCKSSLK